MNNNLEQIKRINLGRALNPKNIALVGATTRSGSFGARTIDNLRGFAGTLRLVNAKYKQLNEYECFPSLAALPDIPDSVIIALPNALVEPVVQECAQLGVGGVVIYASGYAETGRQENIDQQQRLSLLASRTGLRVIGPNCVGVVNYNSRSIQSFQQYPHACQQHSCSIGLVSQSGALSLSLSQAIERDISFSHILTFGNGSDVDVADMINFLVQDDTCNAIACLFEGMSRPERLVEAARQAWEKNKPVILYKLAVGEEGARAALSHTGSLAGSYQIYRTALEKYGVVFVDHFEALLEVASFFAKAPAPITDGVAIVVAAGGAGIMAADKAELHAVPVPQPARHTQIILKDNIPDFGSAKNPCDVTAEVVNNPKSLQACMAAMAEDPAYGAIVVAHSVAGNSFTHRLDLYADIAARYKKPVCTVWLSSWQDGPGSKEFERDPYVPVFHSMDRCFFTLKKWHWRSKLKQNTSATYCTIPADEKYAVSTQLAENPEDKILTERQAKTLLKKYGLTVNQEELVDSIETAIQASKDIGFPVAIKIESPDILHKTEAGVIQLGIQNEQELVLSYKAVFEKAGNINPAPRINGLLVQEMIGAGVELIVGAKIDPAFGPFVIVGFGGVLVEIMKDSVMAPAPVSIEEARNLIESLKGVALLKGFRGSAPVDLDNLSELISRISLFIADHKNQLLELDINPIICNEKGAIAVDALIIKT